MFSMEIARAHSLPLSLKDVTKITTRLPGLNLDGLLEGLGSFT